MSRITAAVLVVFEIAFWLLLLSLNHRAAAAEHAPNLVRAARLQAAYADLERRDFSGFIAIAHADDPVIYREFGTVRDDGISPEETQVDLNSITKTVTGVMVCKLVEMEKARFEETLADVFDNVPDDKAAITIQQLLTHSAGFTESVGNDPEELTRDEFLDRVFRSKLIYPPGDHYEYSNAGYGVLAAIIEVRSGKTYERFLQEDLLAGHDFQNMGYLSIYDDDRALRDPRGRTIIDASWGGHDASWHLIGNGGLVATAPEFIRFRNLVKAGQLISPELVKRAHTPHIKEQPAAISHYGYGLVVQKRRNAGTFYWHDGGNGAYSVQWDDFPEKQDLIFTAAPGERAFLAMTILTRHLYDP